MSQHVYDELVEDALRELADETTQRRLWLASSGLEVSSLEECQCRLYNDSGLGDALDKAAVVYTSELDVQLRKLRTALRHLNGMAPSELLRDAQLPAVRDLAQHLLLQLRSFGHDRTS